MTDWNSMTDTAIMTEIGKRVKEHRLRKNLTQAKLAQRAGVSILPIAKIEQGKSVSLNIFIDVFRALRLLDNLELFIPEMAISPIEMLKLKGQTRQRASKVKR